MKIVIGIIIGGVLTVSLWESMSPLAILVGIAGGALGPAGLVFLTGIGDKEG